MTQRSDHAAAAGEALPKLPGTRVILSECAVGRNPGMPGRIEPVPAGGSHRLALPQGSSSGMT